MQLIAYFHQPRSDPNTVEKCVIARPDPIDFARPDPIDFH